MKLHHSLAVVFGFLFATFVAASEPKSTPKKMRLVGAQIVANYYALSAAKRYPGSECTYAVRIRWIKAVKDFCGSDVESLFTFNSECKRIWYFNDDLPGWDKLEYRDNGRAGALVANGFGNPIEENGIWGGKVRPGAIVQTWKKKASFDTLRKGTDEVRLGHSFVFLEYTKAKGGVIDGMEIADQGTGWAEPEKLTYEAFEFWFAANLKYKLSPPSYSRSEGRFIGCEHTQGPIKTVPLMNAMRS